MTERLTDDELKELIEYYDGVKELIFVSFSGAQINNNNKLLKELLLLRQQVIDKDAKILELQGSVRRYEDRVNESIRDSVDENITLTNRLKDRDAKIQRLVDEGERVIDALLDDDNLGARNRAILAWRKAKSDE
jgi:hypothetical protein